MLHTYMFGKPSSLDRAYAKFPEECYESLLTQGLQNLDFKMSPG